MRAGEVVETGTSAEVVRSPREQYTGELIRAVPVLIELDQDGTGANDAART
jgi:ABC-type dipeptide/oligopeptide/nickel transport system ATPase component